MKLVLLFLLTISPVYAVDLLLEWDHDGTANTHEAFGRSGSDSYASLGQVSGSARQLPFSAPAGPYEAYVRSCNTAGCVDSSAVQYTVSSTNVIPGTYNNIRTNVHRDRPVILPGQVARGDACDTTTYNDIDFDLTVKPGTYDCIDDIPTTGLLIPASDSLSQLETKINNPANGKVFLLDVAGDWSTQGTWQIDRTDATDADPIYILPSDIATRTEGAWRVSSAKIPKLELVCDGNTPVSGIRLIGLDFQDLDADQLLSIHGTCTGQNTQAEASYIVAAWNNFENWGRDVASAIAAVNLRGANIHFLNNRIYNHQNWFYLSNKNRDMDAVRNNTRIGPVYIARNYARGVSGDHYVGALDDLDRWQSSYENNLAEWGPESRMDGDGSGSTLPTLNPNGLFQGGENCFDIKGAAEGVPDKSGLLRGNVCIGQRLNNSRGGSSGGGSTIAFDLQVDATDYLIVHGNFILDTHTTCIGQSRDRATKMDITGNVCEMNANGPNHYRSTGSGQWYELYDWAGIRPNFGDSIVANNTVVCSNGPGVSAVNAFADLNDVKYNVFVNCNANNELKVGGKCTNCLEDNVHRNTPTSGSTDVNPIVDNDAEAYGDLVVTLDHDWFVGESITGSSFVRTYTVAGVVPPENGTTDNVAQNRSFTSGYGTTAPVLRFFDQKYGESFGSGAGAINARTQITEPPPPLPAPQEQPQADLNGYMAYYQAPMLFGLDTLISNWYSRQIPYPQLQSHHTAKAPYSVPIVAGIDCTGTADNQTSDDGVAIRVLKSAGDLVELTGIPVHDVFVLCPGSYEGYVSARLTLGAGGLSAAEPRKLVCAAPDQMLNPVQRNPNYRSHLSGDAFVPNHDLTQECVLPPIRTNGASNWMLSGVTVANSNKALLDAALIHLNGGSDNIIIDRIWAACYNVGTSSSVRWCVHFGEGDLVTDGNVIQNSHVGPCTPYNDASMDGIGLARDATNTSIVNVSVEDCSHAIKAVFETKQGTVQGTVIENLDAYKTEHTRTTCDATVWDGFGLGTRADGLNANRIIYPAGAHQAAFDVTGGCDCGGQLVAMHRGSTAVNAPAALINSRIWGNLPTYSVCMRDDGGQGPDIGQSIVLATSPSNFTAIDNYLGSWQGVGAVRSNVSAPNYSEIYLIRNLLEFMDVADDADITDYADRRHVTLDTECLSNVLYEWDHDGSADGFRIQYSQDGGSLQALDIPDNAARSQSVPHSPGDYSAYVEAYNAEGTGAPSNTENFKVCAAESYTLSDNMFGAPSAGNTVSSTALAASNNASLVYSCNLAKGAVLAVSGNSATGQDNLAVDGARLTAWSALTNTTQQSENEAGLAPITFYRKLQSTPEQYTTQPIQRTVASAAWSCGL